MHIFVILLFKQFWGRTTSFIYRPIGYLTYFDNFDVDEYYEIQFSYLIISYELSVGINNPELWCA